jgi:hypothetical protein
MSFGEDGEPGCTACAHALMPAEKVDERLRKTRSEDLGKGGEGKGELAGSFLAAGGLERKVKRAACDAVEVAIRSGV